MTRDERLMQAVQECFGDVKHWRQSADDLMKELAARGLAVVELDPVSQRANFSSQANSASDREMAIARVLAGHSWDEWRFDMESEGDYPHMSREDWIEHEAARESLRERARAVIAAEDAVGRRG